MNYIELQTAFYHSFVELMTVLFYVCVLFVLVRSALRNRKIFKMVSFIVLIIPFSLLTLTMSVLDYIRH